MTVLLWLLVAVPLGAGAGLAVAGRRGDRAAPAVGVVAAATTLALAAAAAAGRPTVGVPLFLGIRAGLGVDALSAVMVVTTTAITLAVLVYSAGELGPEQARARFYGFVLLFAGAMLVTVTASTLPVLLMAWEVMGATSYALIGFWWREPHRVEAANTAFLITRAGDVGLYLAAGAALAGGVGSLALDRLSTAGPPWLTVVTVGVVLAAFGKAAQLPFSFWLSRAMQGPSPVSALLHSAAMVAAGAYLLLRLHAVLAASGWGVPAVAWVGVGTALVLGLVAVGQQDLKQLLAASTCAQLGFMVLAAGAGGVSGGTQHLAAHAATKALLFLAAGAWLTALGTKQLSALRGAARRHPLTGVAFTAGAATLAGIPPLSIWVTKDAVLASALKTGPALYAAGLAAAVVSAVYSIKALRVVWRPVPADAEGGYDTERLGTRRVTLPMRAALVPLAGLAAMLGALALPPVAGPLGRALGPPGQAAPKPWELALSAALAVGAAAATWWWGDRPAPAPAASRLWAWRWLGLEQLAHRLVVGPVLALARALAAFDDRVVDAGVRQAAAGTRRLAAGLATLDDGGVDAGVRDVATGARRAGRLAQRPQTGQLHHYYAQALALFVALAILLVLLR